MTPVESFFDAIEHSDLSVWVRGGSFPAILTAHVLGTGFVAGTGCAVAMRIFGIARQVPLPLFEKFYPVFWTALAINVASGTLLLAGYPYKAVTNPVFFAKLSCVALGVFLAVKIRNDVLRKTPDGRTRTLAWQQAKILAVLSLGCWIGTITAGRLLAYTYTWLRVGVPGGF